MMAEAAQPAGGSAVGIVEAMGLPSAIVVADAMVKAAPVRLAGIETNTLGAMTIKVVGPTGAVRAAYEAGTALARELDVLVGASIQPNYSAEATWLIDCKPAMSRLLGSRVHLLPAAAGPSDDDALGLIETRGYLAAVVALDAMSKAAKVHVVAREKIGATRVCVLVRGDVAAVRAAIDAGKIEAARVGKLTAAHVIPRPDPVIRRLFP